MKSEPRRLRKLPETTEMAQAGEGSFDCGVVRFARDHFAQNDL
jgi:hypothetical protein